MDNNEITNTFDVFSTTRLVLAKLLASHYTSGQLSVNYFKIHYKYVDKNLSIIIFSFQMIIYCTMFIQVHIKTKPCLDFFFLFSSLTIKKIYFCKSLVFPKIINVHILLDAVINLYSLQFFWEIIYMFNLFFHMILKSYELSFFFLTLTILSDKNIHDSEYNTMHQMHNWKKRQFRSKIRSERKHGI